MKYGLITIDTENSNRGNRLIVYAVKKFLDVGEPFAIAPMFSPISDEDAKNLNVCDFVLLPGSTILSEGTSQGCALNYLNKIKVPVFCTAGCIWEPKNKLNKSVLKYITEPLGVRDPVTYDQCSKQGLKCILTGCPTAYIDKLDNGCNKNVIIGFARTDLKWQEYYFSTLSRNLVASVQEKKYESGIAKKLTQSYFLYEDPLTVYKNYASASLVITGRLHGVLPAMSQNKNVLFFGKQNDSRFSLLSVLGVHINRITGDPKKFVTNSQKSYLTKLNAMRSDMVEWKRATIDQHR